MKDKTSSKHRKLLLTAALVLLAAAVVGMGSYAYNTVQGKINSRVTMHTLTFDVLQEDEAGDPITADDPTTWITPGDDCEYYVYARSTCEEPMYIRAQVGIDVNPLPQMRIEEEVMNKARAGCDKACGLIYNTTDWTYSDGYWYYNRIVEPGAETAPLITGIWFSLMNMGNEYRGTAFTVPVHMDAVQSKNNDHGGSIKALGWA